MAIKTYLELKLGKQVPLWLKFRLSNIAAYRLDYEEFIKYFDLKDKYDFLKFLLDDHNLEDIMRYALTIMDNTSLDTWWINKLDIKKDYDDEDESYNIDDNGYHQNR